MSKNKEELELNFLNGEITRGGNFVTTLDELLFLLDSAVQYNNMCPITESQDFIAELRERIGLGYTKEQFTLIMKAIETGDFSEIITEDE
jgi:hypothetical protein